MKNKKTLFLILLFLVAIGAISPNLRPANAITAAEVFGALFGGTLTLIQHANPVVGAVETLINVVMVVPYAVLLIVSAVFSFISTNLLKIVIAISIHGVSYTNNIAAQAGWPIVRDFANIIVVLGFIGIALATILRWPAEYDAKSTKILPKLILAALLINFSLVICGVIIDISNAAMNYFLNSAGNRFTDYVNTQAFQNIGNVASGIGNNSPLVFGIKVASNVVFNLISGIVMFLFAFLFLFRVMALWILVILSPLAFICAVFPITQEFYQKWKSNFIQWCIIGIPGALFLYLGEQINIELIRAPVNVLGSAINSSPLPGATGITGDPATEILKQLTGLFTFFIPSAFLVLGFLFSIQTSAMGANFAITAGKASGRWYGKFAANKSGLSRLGIAAQDKVTRFAEKPFGIRALSVVQPGTASIAEKQRLAAAKARNAGLTDEEHVKQAEMSVGLMTPQKDREDKAASALILAEKKKFGMVSADKRQEAATHAVSLGASKETLTAEHPELLAASYAEAHQSLVSKREALVEESYIMGGMSQEEAAKKAKENVRLSYKPDQVSIKTEQEAMKEQKIKERTLGYKPVIDEEAKNKVLDDEVERRMTAMTGVKDSSGKYLNVRESMESHLESTGFSPAEIRVKMKEEAVKLRKEIPAPSSFEILRAKESILAERGTPEAAGKDETGITKLLATNPGMTRVEAQQRLINNAYVKWNPELDDATDDEIREAIKKSDAKGAKALKVALKRNILHTVEETYRQPALDNAKKYGERPEEIINADYRYAKHNKKRVDEIIQSKGIDPAAATGAQRAEAEKDATREKLAERMPSMTHDELRNIDKAHLTSPEGYDLMAKLAPEKTKAFETADQPTREAVRSHIPQIRKNMFLAKKAAEYAMAKLDASGAPKPQDKNEAAVQNRKYNELYKAWKALLKVNP